VRKTAKFKTDQTKAADSRVEFKSGWENKKSKRPGIYTLKVASQKSKSAWGEENSRSTLRREGSLATCGTRDHWATKKIEQRKNLGVGQELKNVHQD